MVDIPAMPRAAVARPYRPPAPIPHTKRMSRLQFILSLRRNPVETWGVWHFEKPVVSGVTVMGHVTVVSAPEAIKHIMVDNVGNYVKDRLQLKVLKPGLGEGLLTAEGENWKVARRTLAPLFSPRAVEGFTTAMQERSAAMVTRLQKLENGTRVNVSDEMARITFEILAETLFSNAITTDQQKFAKAFTAYFENQGRISPLDIFNAPAWIPRPGKILAQPAIQFLEGEMRQIIARRRAQIARGEPVSRDILTLLLEANDPETGQGLSETEVGANIVTFIGAGHETTANALSWTLFLLAKHPLILAQVEVEADRAGALPVVDWLENLPMTRAVFEEAMRLYPPAPTLSRTALAEDEVMGITIPAKSLVVISPYIVHRHKLLWEEPNYFRPERFLPGAREKIDRFAYIPFGAGPRVCIGQRFAQHEAVIILASLLRQVRFSMAKGEGVVPVQRITLRPSPKLEMLITQRHPLKAG